MSRRRSNLVSGTNWDKSKSKKTKEQPISETTSPQKVITLRIRVRLHGFLHTYTNSESPEFELELPDKTSLTGLIRNLKIPDPEIGVVSLNGKSVPLSAVLSNNDVVSVFPPVSGG